MSCYCGGWSHYRESHRVYSLVDLVEVLLALGGLVDHSRRTRGPAGGAHLTVLVGVLERLHQAQHFVDRAADGEVVDHHRAKHTLGVDDEETAAGGSETTRDNPFRTYRSAVPSSSIRTL